MKTRVIFRIALTMIVLAILAGFGLAQASQPHGETASIQPDARWFTDYDDTNGDVGTHVAIAFDPSNDAPWVSYYDTTNTALKVAHYVGATGGNCGPDNTWYCEIVDGSPDVGTYSSIDVYPDTNPSPFISTWKVGVSYYDATNKMLMYATYSCFLGCSWAIYTVDSSVDTGDSIGKFTSLKFHFLDGTPHIAYYEYDDPDPMIATYAVKRAYYKGGGTGNCGDSDNWQCDRVDSSISPTLGQYASLDINYGGNVYIAYYDGYNDNLKYAYFSGIGNCGTGSAWYCQTIDDGNGADVGKFASLHAPDSATDVLRVAYYDYTNGKLKYAYDITGNGNCGPGNGWQCDAIDSMGAGLTQVGISLAVDSSNDPIIAYMDASDALGPTKLNVAYLELFGGCGPEIPFSTWRCTTIDNGGAYQDEAKYASIALNSGGLATIAYSELDTYAFPNEYDLKIAYQRAMIFLPIVKR